MLDPDDFDIPFDDTEEDRRLDEHFNRIFKETDMNADNNVDPIIEGEIVHRSLVLATKFDGEKRDLLKRTICKGATDDELELFIAVCERKRLDPFSKQIYAVKRWDGASKREVMSFQTGIDGFRSIAERTGQLDGTDGPYWCGPDGQWKDIWTNSGTPPYAAKFVIYRKNASKPFAGVARWDAYAQTKKDGGYTSFWQKMGPEQLAKCAESLALRRAFPEDLSGLYTNDEMMQADKEEAPKPPSNGNGKRSPGADLLAQVKDKFPGSTEVNEHGEPKATPERVAVLKALIASRKIPGEKESKWLEDKQVKTWDEATPEVVENAIKYLEKMPAKAA